MLMASDATPSDATPSDATPSDTTELGPRLARGATAEVFAYGDGRVLKLLLAGRPRDAVEREAALGRLVRAAGVPAPDVYETIELGGRLGTVFERVDGPTMLDAIVAQPWRVLRLAPLLAELHVRVHRAPLGDDARRALRPLADQLERKIGQYTHTPPHERAMALERLAALRAEYAGRPSGLCHGDFHPGNVVLTARGPSIVDWNDATLGPPAADVARTEVLMLRAALPSDVTGVKRLAIQTTRRLLYTLYLRRYRALTGLAPSDVAAWRTPVIIARRAEGVERR